MKMARSFNCGPAGYEDFDDGFDDGGFEFAGDEFDSEEDVPRITVPTSVPDEKSGSRSQQVG